MQTVNRLQLVLGRVPWPQTPSQLNSASICLSCEVMPKPSPGRQPEPEASRNGEGMRYMLVLIPGVVYYPGQLAQRRLFNRTEKII